MGRETMDKDGLPYLNKKMVFGSIPATEIQKFLEVTKEQKCLC